MTPSKSVVGFGELLWDMLPTGKVAGGAPMNVAYHAKQFGMEAQMISAVGNDDLGKALITFLQQKGIPTNLVHTNYTFGTSTVQVTLNEKGSASYEIVAPVAWDFLFADESRNKAVIQADYLLFGSLICRSEANLKTLLHLADQAQTVVFDVNLRPPFYSQALIEPLLQKADIVKMNEEELAIILNWYGIKGDLNNQMASIMEKFELETLVMTQGKHGAFCMHDGVLYAQKSFPVTVKDTVGSGDSFLAAFIYKMSIGANWQDCLEFACATGAFVATQSGGTPAINENIVLNFIPKK
ncbi:MAG: carbohydrate kinase family protein [Saprospiraceae bacterium]